LPHPLLPDITAVAASTAAAHGFELADIQILTHLQPMTVQVQIRRGDGSDVSLDDCAGFSGPMGEALEAQALLTEAYVLEISSPGIGDQLQSDRDFQTFRSYPVEVLYRDDEGREQRQQGSLLERNDDHVQVNVRGRIKRISRPSVISVQLISPTG
jgi:ribosome maturation factor RimP